ncbi:MAG: tetratricopeptide repeat protein [Nitrospirae bacterium]|nr:tetratricopeptide repeat protein [Nitrospirota bacterium]
MKKLVFIFFTICLFSVFLTPMELGDVWWHLKTGSLIWANQELPSSDPFSLAPPVDKEVLTPFWLFQLIIYGLYSVLGISGLVYLKALVFSGSVLLLNAILKDYGMTQAERYILLLPTVFIATYYDEIRPQTVSFLFFTFTFYLLERKRSKWLFLLLPPVMLLWSNMHAGYVSGVTLIVLYCLRDAIKKKWSHLLAYVLSLLASALNPNGLKAVSWTWNMLLGSIKGAQVIHEHLGLIEFTSLTGQRNLRSSILILLALGILSLIPVLASNIKEKQPRIQIDLTHLILFIGLGTASIATFRAGMFFSIIATAFIGKNLAPLTQGLKLIRARSVLLELAMLIVFLIAGFFLIYPRTILKNSILPERLLPVKTVNFMLSSAPPKNIFHPYEWGGYLIWRLHPKYKVFIDGRALGLMKDYLDVLTCTSSWKETLKKHEVNTVIYWALLPYKGRVPQIVLCLLKDQSWSPVYWDLQSIAFVRTELAKNPINKTRIWEFLTFLISSNIKASPLAPENYVALGVLYLEMGMKADALKAFKVALSLEPENKEALLYYKALYGSESFH